LGDKYWKTIGRFSQKNIRSLWFERENIFVARQNNFFSNDKMMANEKVVPISWLRIPADAWRPLTIFYKAFNECFGLLSG
jgi:hypothetical protein